MVLNHSRVCVWRNDSDSANHLSTTRTEAQPDNWFKSEYSKIVITGDTLTLVRPGAYRDMKQTVNCPNCKDLWCADFQPSQPGAKIIDAHFIRSRKSGLWFRCQFQASCGRPEFSNPSNAQQECGGLSTCRICRTTDDAIGAEDDVLVNSYMP